MTGKRLSVKYLLGKFCVHSLNGTLKVRCHGESENTCSQRLINVFFLFSSKTQSKYYVNVNTYNNYVDVDVMYVCDCFQQSVEINYLN